MKKTLFGLLVAAAFTMTLASCGEKLLTTEQLSAKIEEGYTAGKAAIETEMNAKCEADFDTRVTAEVDRLNAESKAKMEAEKAAMEEAKKAAKMTKKKK